MGFESEDNCSVSPGKKAIMVRLPTFQAFRKVHPDMR